MSFTEVFDPTFPPDTQAANQLGADIRNFKLDIQQRMAAASGLDADKPAFEAGFAGVLYFATDTGKFWQWSGSAWVDVTADFIQAQQTTIINMPFSATPIFDASTLSKAQAAFEITLSGDVTSSTIVNITEGQLITFIVHQDSVGGHSFSWPGTIYGQGTIDNTSPANSTSTQMFIVQADGISLRALTPVIES